MTGDKFQVCFVQARYKTNLCRILVSSNTSLRPSANSLLQTQTAEMRCEQPFALLQECPCASLPKVYIISFYQKPLSDLNSHLGASLLFTGGRRLKPEILSDLSAPTDSCTTLSLSLSLSLFFSLSLSIFMSQWRDLLSTCHTQQGRDFSLRYCKLHRVVTDILSMFSSCVAGGKDIHTSHISAQAPLTPAQAEKRWRLSTLFLYVSHIPYFVHMSFCKQTGKKCLIAPPVPCPCGSPQNHSSKSDLALQASFEKKMLLKFLVHFTPQARIALFQSPLRNLGISKLVQHIPACSWVLRGKFDLKALQARGNSSEKQK